jgi:APA family basic amino acid/polyamine antiporter
MPAGDREQPPSRLDRRLGLADAVVVGLGAMLGTGVFVVFAPAAAAAGPWLLLGLLLAAGVAYCNATSTAQLAAVHPESGGAYAYGRARLGPSWGALAGFAFLAGKTASCAAAALAVGAYAWPEQQRLVAALTVLAATALNYVGVARTVAVTWVLVVVLVGVLLVVAAVTLTGGGVRVADNNPGSPSGVLSAAALLFFAFAGYARVATLGEEVRDPAVTIPRAVPIALGTALLLYALVALGALTALGSAELAAAAAPLSAAVDAVGASWLVPVVRVGAAVAAGAVLLSLVAGVGRTAFAMAAAGDLPRALAAVHARYRVPHRAQLLVGLATLAATVAGELTAAVAFSAFTVLVYYAVANLAAMRLGRPRAVSVLGLAGCLALAVSLPLSTVVAGTLLLLGCLIGRVLAQRLQKLA